MRDHDWIDSARDELLAARRGSPAWGYRVGSAPASEPTALAALALSAETSRPGRDGGVEAVRLAADWLAAAQRADGSVGIGADPASGPPAGWMTPYAMLVWATTPRLAGPVRRASDWLLDLKGRTIDRRDDPSGVAGHDTTIVGWPWVAETHSWLEPTALAVLALGRAGYASHPRVREGLRLIRNRAIDTGGWNYGNKSVFGRTLRAHPAPTGLALIALAGSDGGNPAVDRAREYLETSLPGVRASASLGWGLLGLSAWGERPRAAGHWLAEAYEAVRGKPDAAPKLACLLLAAGGQAALPLLGRAGRPTQTTAVRNTVPSGGDQP